MKKINEGRKPILRSLLPLAEACPEFTGFAKGENRSERIHGILLGLIQRYRQAAPRPFYAMREVADFFQVSLTSAYMIYRRLHREGAVTLMRSSQTMITPRVPRSRLAVRGVVCMPIWLPGFLHFLDWRNKFSELEAELSRHRFVLEPVFYRQGEDIASTFVDRVLDFNPDYVLWDSPVETDRSTLQSIIDAGIPVLSVIGPHATMPGRIYRRSYRQGLQRGLEDWKAGGEIDRIIIPKFAKDSHPYDLMSVIHDSSLPYEFKDYEYPNTLPQYFKRLTTARRAGIVFIHDLFFVWLCTLAPEAMFNLFRRNRVIVLRQFTIPCLAMPAGLTVDAILFSGKQLARRIAVDLSQSKGSLPSSEEVFEAEWCPRTPIEDIAQITFSG